MKATQLIHQLAELVAKHGDLPVTVGYRNLSGEYVTRNVDGFAAYNNEGAGVSMSMRGELSNFGALLGAEMEGTRED